MNDRPGQLLLHGYWRSGTSYRTRIALALKGVDAAQATHDLRCGEQRAAGYRAIHPQGLVPALETAGGVLIQSGAIIEWLEETWPEPPLLPADRHGRAVVRGMADLIGCDIHPLNNVRVLDHLRGQLAAGEDAVAAWIGRWIGEGFAALERLLEVHAGAYCFGDSIGMADCYLVPQVYSARRFGVPLTDFPQILRVAASAEQVPAVIAAAPERQADAPAARP